MTAAALPAGRNRVRTSIGLGAIQDQPTARVTSAVRLRLDTSPPRRRAGEVRRPPADVRRKKPRRARELTATPRNPAAAGWVVAMPTCRRAAATSRADVAGATVAPE